MKFIGAHIFDYDATFRGSLGIGTDNPDSLLEISSSSTSNFLKLTTTGSGANPIKLVFEKAVGQEGIIEYNRNGDLEIYNTDNDGGVMIDGSASAGADFYVAHDGNVSIGTTLTVTGNITANGNIIGDDSTNITNIDSVKADTYAADANETTKFSMSATGIDCLVDDTDVFQVTDSTFTFDPAVKTTIKKRKLTKTSNTDGNHDGDVVFFGGTTSMTAGSIYFYNSGSWELADADAESTSKGMLAVALGAASDTNGMLIRGMVTLSADPGTISDKLYLSTTAGRAQNSAPAGSGKVVRLIGYSLDSTNGQVYFNPDNHYTVL